MPDMSLKTKVSLAVSLFVTVVISVLAFSVLRYFEGELKNTISRHQFAMISAMAEEVDSKLQNARQGLVAVAETINTDLSLNRAEAQRFLDSHAGIKTIFDSSTFIFSPKGTLIAVSPREPQIEGRDYSYRDYIRNTVATGKPQISMPFLSTQSHHHPIVMFTAPFFNAEGEMVGILTGALDLMRDNFLGNLAAVKLGKKGYLYLYCVDRTMIVHPDRTRILRRDVPPGVNRLFDLAIQGFEGTGETVNSRGLNALSSFKHLKTINWILAANFPQSEAYAPINEAKWYLLVATIITLILSNVFVWWIMRHLMAPLSLFTTHVKKITCKEIEPVPIPIASQDEIGTLAQSFNEMLGEMEAHKKAIRKQKEFSENLILNSALPTFVLDAGHRVIIWNKACEELTGVKGEEVLNTTGHRKAFYSMERSSLADVIIDGRIDALHEYYPSYNRSPFTPDGLQAEGWCRMANGITRYIFADAVPVRDADGNTIAVIETLQDITERKRDEDELEFKNVVLSIQQETSMDGILIVDDDDTIISYNRRFVDLWEVPPDLVEARDDAQVLRFATAKVADSEDFVARIRCLNEHREERSREEILLKDGRIFDRYTSPLFGIDGKYFGRVWYFRDITERKKMEEELLRAQKLESLGVLAGGIAHDFNNLLTGIMGNISLARMCLDPAEKAYFRLAEAERACSLTRDLTGQLLTFAKGGAPVKKAESISHILTESAGFVLRGSNVGCAFSLPDDLWDVEVDGGQMSQVANNLLINADQAMPEGGVVSVHAENTVVPADTTLPLREGRYVHITIRDEGEGIPEENLTKIFDPYFTTKKKGSGLGLASVYSIITKHDGHVSVESKPGEGAAFHIYLRASERCGKRETVSSSTNKPGIGNGCVLVMDDEKMVSRTARDILDHLGYRVDVCADGAAALKLYREAKESGKPYSIVFMDLTIPGGMGGKVAMEKLLEIDPDAKGVVMSGYSDDPILANYRQYGFCGVIVKPFTAEEILGVLQTSG